MIFVAGSANLDFVVRAAHIPAPGETVLGRDFVTFPGGKGANQAVACARAGGAATEMLLALGQDAQAAVIEASLRDAGVTLHLVRDQHQATGCAFICVSDDAENAITVAPGANQSLRPQHLPALSSASHLMLQLETPVFTVIAYAKAARTQGVQVVLNAAPAKALNTAQATEAAAELLSLVDLLIVNEGELAVVAGVVANQHTVAECLARIDVPRVVVTLGPHGSCARVDGKVFLQPAYPVKAVDTTAAGDTFCGALVAALDRQLDFAQALVQASAAAALACARPGAQASIPTQKEVQAFLQGQPSATPARQAELVRLAGF